MTSGWIRHTLGAFSLDMRWAAAPGEIVTLFGPSGAGKSTTLRAIAGLVRPREGRIEVGGVTVFDSESGAVTPPHRRRVGYMPQDYALFPHMTVRGNIGFPLRGGAFPLRGMPQSAVASRVDELLEALHIAELAGRYPRQISRGQQQRVALARALAPRPAVLLLDEPFSALDLELRRALRLELKAVRDRERLPIILVTHDLDDALALSDRVLAVDRGRVVAEGLPLAVLERPSVARLSRLVEVENVFQATVLRADRAQGVLACDLGGATLEIPYAPLEAGAAVRIGVRAGDVMLATELPHGLSAGNVLPARVVSLAPRGFEVLAQVDCGAPFTAQLTPRAVQRLGIAPGAQVWVVVKSNSCFVIE
ncbi:MAG: ATP-binding cassette domain-containing protein [Dehalococcoidia bacterium]|nr:ATP-binding cassette domain-containing protein [Dehalococcoidia bacterium]